jgi:hypothetical protein
MMGPAIYIRLTMPLASRGGRVTVLGYDAATDELVATDEANLLPLQGRQRLVQHFADKLQFDEAQTEAFALELDKQWLAFYQECQKRLAAGAAQANAAELLQHMPADIQKEAETILHQPHLVGIIQQDIEALGVAGERDLALTIYLTGLSRQLDKPLAARVHGPTASGKSYLISAVTGLFPPETVLQATQITPQALYYLEPGALRHRFIVAGERSRLQNDETAEATRALRELLSAGRLVKLRSLGGETRSIEQTGPIAFLESTSLPKVFDEDANRCLTLCTDERPEQTHRIIHSLAQHYLGRGHGIDRERIRQRHFALQRLLQPLRVVIPYADRLAELMDCGRVELRRSFPQLLSMIQVVTLLHQYQRARDEQDRLVATAADYRLARQLLLQPMERLLGSGLSASARRFHHRLRQWFPNRQPFTTTEARSQEAHSKTAVQGWLQELLDARLVQGVSVNGNHKELLWQWAGNDADELAPVLPAVDQVCAHWESYP